MQVESQKVYYQKGFKYKVKHVCVFVTDLRPEKAVVTPWCSLTMDGILTANPGYGWDGPSGPTIDWASAMRASLFHDLGYELSRKGHLAGEANRRKIDRGFYERLRIDGMWKIRAKVWYRSVRRWAKGSSITGRPVLSAP